MSQKYPKISVVTPSYNQGKYLEDTIRSVIEQDYPNLEYIIIDGGSTDNSVDIIRKYEKHLAYWISEQDGGLYHGLQKGFDRSTGNIMAWINSDDMYHRKAFFAVADIFNHFQDVNWIMGRNTFYDEEGKIFAAEPNKYHECWSKWRLYDFVGTEFIQQESVFWRRSLWEKAGKQINTNLALAADFELWLRFFRYDKLYTTNFILAGFRYRTGNQKSKDNYEDYVKEVKSLLSKEKESAKV